MHDPRDGRAGDRPLTLELRHAGHQHDDRRALVRFSAAVWFSVGIAALAVLPARDVLEPGTTLRLLWSAAFALTAGLIMRWLPLGSAVAGDLALRAVGMTVLHVNVTQNLTSDYWLLCLPMFLSSIIIPALFYRTLPLVVVTAGVAGSTGMIALGADAPAAVRAVTWGTFMWIMVLIVGVIRRLATERRRTLDAMTALAATDSLTSLPNRRHFMTAAAQMLATADEQDRSCTLVLLDVDHFKSVNDVYGHDAGDQVLVGVAAAMRGACRTDDLIARLGGEEFAILMLGASVLHAQYVAAELAATLRSVEPIGVTASYGVVEARPGETDIGDLLVRADLALYQAKRAGRNRCVVES